MLLVSQIFVHPNKLKGRSSTAHYTTISAMYCFFCVKPYKVSAEDICISKVYHNKKRRALRSNQLAVCVPAMPRQHVLCSKSDVLMEGNYQHTCQEVTHVACDFIALGGCKVLNVVQGVNVAKSQQHLLSTLVDSFWQLDALPVSRCAG